MTFQTPGLIKLERVGMHTVYVNILLGCLGKGQELGCTGVIRYSCSSTVRDLLRSLHISRFHTVHKSVLMSGA